MFTYFNTYKNRYNKGQMAPFFILILVLLIVMALVTVNLSKVAFIKTDSANAVDAGALAAGSAMANVFNSLAQSNSQMEVAFREFHLAALAELTIAIGLLTYALIQANLANIPSPCSAAIFSGHALTAVKLFVAVNWGLIISVTAYHIAQYLFYKNIRKSVESGRKGALSLGYRFAFINSGIGSKLKEEQREDFSEFLDTIKAENLRDDYEFKWKDGQARDHRVDVSTQINPVQKYRLRVTLAPLFAELGLLTASLVKGYAAKASLIVATALFTIACALLATWFGWAAAWPIHAKGLAALEAAVTSISISLGAIVLAAGGLTPAYTVDSDAVEPPVTFIICWIDDVEHDRLVRVDTRQHHKGKLYGQLWEANYPDRESFSQVDFRGKGQIYPPVFRHDPSIVKTDNNSGVVYNIGPLLQKRVADLAKEISALEEYIGDYNLRIEKLKQDEQVAITAGQARNAATQKSLADGLQRNVDLLEREIEHKAVQIEQIKTDNPQYFTGGMNSVF